MCQPLSNMAPKEPAGSRRAVLVPIFRRTVMGKKLYVGNLSYDVDSSELEQLFGAHGQIGNQHFRA